MYLERFSPVRFRSIAKSYFRRADGVLLLYDVTCERSFLNVREWVDMIEVMHHSPLTHTGWIQHLAPDFGRIWVKVKSTFLSFVLVACLFEYEMKWSCLFLFFTCSRYVSVGCALNWLCSAVKLWACWHFCDFFYSCMQSVTFFYHVLSDIMHHAHQWWNVTECVHSSTVWFWDTFSATFCFTPLRLFDHYIYQLLCRFRWTAATLKWCAH